MSDTLGRIMAGLPAPAPTPARSAPEACGQAPEKAGIDPAPARTCRDRDRVIHKYSRRAASHWHYHYKPVPAEEVQPPRNRNVVLPRKGGILDATG